MTIRPRRRAHVLTCAVAAMALTTGACDPFNTGFADSETGQAYTAAQITDAPENPSSLVVMNWNAKYGAGRIDFFFDCHGDRGIMNEEEVTANLQGLADKIKSVDPDILMLQEIDVASKRAAYIDQVQYLLDATDLNYAVYASQWKADYVPSDGVGPVNSGNVIMSKYPLSDSERIAMPLIDEQDGLTQYFYLQRNILKTKIDVGSGDGVWAVNVHTAAYSTDGTKKKQIDQFKAELDAMAEAGQVFVAGGDLNTLPPGSTKVDDFDDSVCEEGGDFDAGGYGPEADWLSALYADYTPAIPLDEYQADNSLHYTHTTDKDGFWNRKLDYLFTNGTFTAGSGLTHQDVSSGGVATMPLSDHAPVSVTWELP